jgi:glycogen(starch) synthase
LGVPSITTNLSGFGCYIEERVENPSRHGIYIIDRRLKSIEESIEQLVDYMYQFCQKTRRQRIALRNRTERLSDLLDWKMMGREYMKAHILTLKTAYPDQYLHLDISKLDIPIPEFSRSYSLPSPMYGFRNPSDEDKGRDL